MQIRQFYDLVAGPSLLRTNGEDEMPRQTKRKKAQKTKGKRSPVSFQKEPWYAMSAARFSAARPNHKGN